MTKPTRKPPFTPSRKRIERMTARMRHLKDIAAQQRPRPHTEQTHLTVPRARFAVDISQHPDLD